MNKKDFQKLVNENINPDYYFEERLKAKVMSAEPSTRKKKSTKRIWISVLSGVMCFVLALGIFGFTQHSNKVLPGSVMIAGADVLESNVDIQYHYGVAFVDKRGKTEAEYGAEMNEKKALLDHAVNEETIHHRLGHRVDGSENIWMYTVEGDSFDIKVDNPEEVKEIRIHNDNPMLLLQYEFYDGEWSEEELFMMTEEDEDYWTEVDTDDEWYMLGKNGEKMYWEEFIRHYFNSLHIGNDLTADGERFARAKALEAKEDLSSTFCVGVYVRDEFIYGDKYTVISAMEKDPSFQITSIHDKVTFEVEFKNGDVAKSVVNIGFNDDGFMIVSLDSYEYIKA